jgi:hypothetical protein
MGSISRERKRLVGDGGFVAHNFDRGFSRPPPSSARPPSRTDCPITGGRSSGEVQHAVVGASSRPPCAPEASSVACPSWAKVWDRDAARIRPGRGQYRSPCPSTRSTRIDNHVLATTAPVPPPDDRPVTHITREVARGLPRGSCGSGARPGNRDLKALALGGSRCPCSRSLAAVGEAICSFTLVSKV